MVITDLQSRHRHVRIGVSACIVLRANAPRSNGNAPMHTSIGGVLGYRQWHTGPCLVPTLIVPITTGLLIKSLAQ